jgi:hypothetical protein
MKTTKKNRAAGAIPRNSSRQEKRLTLKDMMRSPARLGFTITSLILIFFLINYSRSLMHGNLGIAARNIEANPLLAIIDFLGVIVLIVTLFSALRSGNKRAASGSIILGSVLFLISSFYLI